MLKNTPNSINVNLKDIGDLATLISEIDMAQAGLSGCSIKDLCAQAHTKIVEILGENQLAIYAQGDH